MTQEATFEEKLLLDLAYHYREQFYKTDSEVFLRILGRGKVVAYLFYKIYLVLLKFDGILPIEEIDSEEKWKWFNEAKRVSEIHTKEHLKNVSIAIYTLFSLTEQ